MKNILVTGLLVFIIHSSFGQQYQITEETQRINSKKIDGVSSKVDGALDNVEKYWLSYIRDHGKARRKRNYFQLTEFSVEDLGIDTLTYVTRIEDNNGSGKIWIAPFDNNLTEAEIVALNNDLEKILKTATRGYYISEVQKKIDESEEAAIIMSKNHQKLIYEGEKLKSDSTAAANLKVELEQRLENTILKLKILRQEIIDNIAAREQAYKDLEEIKKVIEGHKEDLKKIR